MSRIRVCFLGTPAFALTSLKSLITDEHFEVVGVVTQPDRPSGRKMQIVESPVKKFSRSVNLPVLSPQSLGKDANVLEEIKKWKAEVAIVVAFGQILRPDFLAAFPLGVVNVHGSLLPRWRGAAPIQRAIEAGDHETGVCLQKVVQELDAGDVIGSRSVEITENMDALELHDLLAPLGADLLKIELMDYLRGNLVAITQDTHFVTIAPKLLKSEGQLNFDHSAHQLQRQIRAYLLGPGTFSFLNKSRIKFFASHAVESSSAAKVGKVIEIKSESFLLQTGDGALEILRLQPESKPVMNAKEFMQFANLKIGDQFGGLD